MKKYFNLITSSHKKSKHFKSRTFGVLFIGCVILYGSFFLFDIQGKIENYSYQKYFHPTFLDQKPRIVIPVKIGLINDAHAKTSFGSLIKRTQKPLVRFNAEMKNFQPDFLVDNGDLIEGTVRVGAQSISDYHLVNNLFTQSGTPAYHVLGNHDLRGLTKQQWLQLTGYEKPYYFFDKGVYRFIVIDANSIPHPDYDEDVTPQKEYLRGYVAKEQMRWLEDLLSQTNNLRKIIFIHQPPLDSTVGRIKASSFPYNAKQLRQLFSKYRVRAVFSGHIEEKIHQDIDGVDYYVLPGFYKAQRNPEDEDDKQIEIYHGVYTEIEAGSQVKVRMFYADDETGEEKSLEF